MFYRIINDKPIKLSSTSISIEMITDAIEATNLKLRKIADATKNMSVDIFQVLDLRTLSGAVGETFVSEMDARCPTIRKNPSIDGYPDLVQCATDEMRAYFDEYAKHDSKESFRYGGIEVKDTFGYKKRGIALFDGEQRIGKIQKDLQWKAHHQKTNHLLGLFSDYIEGYPTIVAAFYSDQLKLSDWTKKAEPKKDSAMTSFSTLQKSGFEKMRMGIRICLDDSRYLSFLGQEVRK